MNVSKESPYSIRSRVDQEKLEDVVLAPFACKSYGMNETRRFDEQEHAYRTCFQRDRDRILHSRAFRRLKHKRQVFLTSESDHYRTRITHTLEVAQLSRSMARALSLNEDLVEAIALGHDLGHTPFGHLGEVILDEIMSGKRTFVKQEHPFRLGGFKHNYQSVRIVDSLERKYDFQGLNLTAPVREGILKHTRLRRGKFDYPDFHFDGLYYEKDAASTLEGQVVAICDEIAQRTHDLEDGIRAGLVPLEQVQELEIAKALRATSSFGRSNTGALIHGLINLLVDDVIEHTLLTLSAAGQKSKKRHGFEKTLVCFSDRIDRLQAHLNKFIYKEIIHYSRAKWSDELGKKLLFRLFEAYYLYPDVLPEELRSESPPLELSSQSDAELRTNPVFLRSVCDYIAGMTDHYALSQAVQLSQQNKVQVSDLKVERALGNYF